MALSRNPPPTRKPPFELVERIGFVRLYLDDIDALLAYLRGTATGVSLSAGRAVADEAGDLRSATSAELKRVAISTESPSMTVWLNANRAQALTAEDTEAARQLTAATASMIREHRGGTFGRYLRVLLSAGLSGLGLVAVGIFILIFGTAEWRFTVGAFAIPAGLAIAFGLAAMVWQPPKQLGGARIYPRLRSESREAGSTVRTALITGVVVAIVTAVATAIATAVWGTA